MEYGKLMSRSANIVLQHKFLIMLGFLASLGSGSLGSGGGGDGSGNGGGDLGQFSEFREEIAALAVGFILTLVCLVLFVGIVLWVVSTIARGGLIESVDAIESGQESGFRLAWSAGWHKGWSLLGIGLLPAIPGLILFVGGLLTLGIYGGIFALFDQELAQAGTAGLGITIAFFACFLIPIALVLAILRNFAERACMLENLGVIDAYRRGWQVLTANIGEALILFLLQVVTFIVLGIFLFVPGIIAVICCFLWPLLLVVQGAISAFISTLWTLAWHAWTGKPPSPEKAPAAS